MAVPFEMAEGKAQGGVDLTQPSVVFELLLVIGSIFTLIGRSRVVR